MTPEIEKYIIAYGGADYAKPQDVVVATLEFSEFDTLPDLRDAIEEFLKNNAGCTFERQDAYDDYSTCVIGFSAHRPETAAETAARIDHYRKVAEQQIAERKAEYEKMKAEFEPTITPDQENQ